MKKIILVFLVAAMFGNLAKAQDDGGGGALPFKIGLKAGTNRSTILREGVRFTTPRLGWTAGVTGEMALGDKLSCALELMYFQGGAVGVYESYAGTTYTNGALRLQNLDIPVLLNYTPSTDGKIVPRFVLGHAFGINIYGSNQMYVNNGTTVNGEQIMVKARKLNVSDRYDKLDCAIITGVGLDIKTDGLTYTIDARYRWGYSDITRSVLNKYTTNTLSVLVGVKF